ncbi:MAG: adenylate/guanylate cyclase domain-containing protein [Anaerolineae bacterium]|nr:adenylate/guanylate cyclase domain-containing protein [Anaerolineae bacterium]
MLSYSSVQNFVLHFNSQFKQIVPKSLMAWKTFTYRWQWQLKSSPEALWPYVADTQRFNQAAHLPIIAYLETPLDTGGSRLTARTGRFGLTVEFEDHPFEWVREQEFRNVRTFSHGPLAETRAHLQLQPHENGAILKYEVDVTPANLIGLLGIPYQFGWEMQRNFGHVFRTIDAFLQQQTHQPFPLKIIPLTEAGQARLQELTQQLASQGHDLRWVQHLADLIVTEADVNLARIRPYVLADAWQAPRRAILEMCLSAAKLGLLNLRWDLLCPLCRGVKSKAASLDEVSKGVHCATCNINFEVDFSQNVELTFTPHPQIRAVHDGSYCVGGPMVTPHILVHQIIQPGETRRLQVNLEPGRYRFRTQRPGVEAPVEWQTPLISLSAKTNGEMIEAVAQPAPPQAKNSCPEITLTLTNNAGYPQRIYLEQAAWYADAATAAQVTALQHFRDLFSDEVLRPGEEIGVQSVTILFSDLVGSTAMYNRWGDAASYALVREQFAFLQRIIRDYEGAIVKTIGDAIMAVFADPAKGVGAALAIQQQINDFNASHLNEPLIIKLGLHQGPCLAVNLNDRLDYFGTTVNLAARLQDQSKGGDVIVSEKLRHDPAVAHLLDTLGVNVAPFATSIKGFDEHFSLFRLTLPPKHCI